MDIYRSEPAAGPALATHVQQWITEGFPVRKQNLIKRRRPEHKTSVFRRRCSFGIVTGKEHRPGQMSARKVTTFIVALSVALNVARNIALNVALNFG